MAPGTDLRSKPLDRKESDQLLRYWLAILRHEEALATRPKARRLHRNAPIIPNVKQPREGHGYFKLLPSAVPEVVDLVVGQQGRIELPFDAERAAFFEHVLHGRYRQGSDGPERVVEFIAGFPTVLLPRGELAPLLRCAVEVSFRSAAGVFEAPDWLARKRGRFPPAPDQLVISVRTRDEDEGHPYFVDTALLQHVLGITPEHIGDFMQALRGLESLTAPQMVDLLTQLLEDVSFEDGAPEPRELDEAELFAALSRVVGSRLEAKGAGARVYPVALVFDGTRTRATWYLQRDLFELLDHGALRMPWGRNGPIGAYLSGGAPASGWSPRSARWRGVPLTADQSAATERFLGSKLSAVQGPPGTGKTTLILGLAAEAVVEGARQLAAGRGMPPLPTMVASTNNQAVDNVTDPLTRLGPERLAIALRVGSRDVTSRLTLEQLQTARGWLSRQPDADAEEALEAALEAFRAAAEVIDSALAPVKAARDAATRLPGLLAERAQFAVAQSDGPEIPTGAVQPAIKRLSALDRRLDAMLDILSGRAGALQRLTLAWGRAKTRRFKSAQRAVERAGLELPIVLPPQAPDAPDEAALLAAWEAAIEKQLDLVGDLLSVLRRVSDHRKIADRQATVAAEIERLQVIPEAEADEATLDAAREILTEAAIVVRERWAIARRGALLDALERGIVAAGDMSSLRRLYRDEPSAMTWLCRLFPVWGCTLLSLGNVFPPEADCLRRVIIDEAGQCHPAYAVSALMRAQSALLIGDVFQLEPVITLTEADEQRIRRAAEVKVEPARLGARRIFSGGSASAQAVADAAVDERPTLRDHFRCQREIIEICDALCSYDLRPRAPVRSKRGTVPFLAWPTLLLETFSPQERAGGSWSNPGEADVVLRLLQRLSQHGVSMDEIGVITPYRGQLRLLERRLKAAGVSLRGELDTGPTLFGPQGQLALGTVHQFQGGERPLILFSAVVSASRSLRFLNDRVNLINVAVSRAREHFITIGTAECLAGGQFTRLLVERSQRLGETPA